MITACGNLLGPDPVLLPDRPGGRRPGRGTDPAEVAAPHPTSSLAWAVLAERALTEADGDLGGIVAGYAYARTGYHRGLDQLRRSGWKGAGPVPWSHEPNRGLPARAGRAAPGRRPRSARPTRRSAAGPS